jgi:cytochrome oxidase Cu insertion factor (SCO1/SenC/PrrC family)/YHS domain-containing protein
MKHKKVKKRYTLPWWPVIVISGVWLILLWTLKPGGLFSSNYEASPTSHLATGELPVLWNVPALSSINQNDQPITNADLQGHVLILDFIFTHCTSACPLITAQMVMLQRIIQQPQVRFLSVSVDPAHDTPAVLKDYAANWNGEDARWQLLHLPSAALRQFAMEMKVAVLPSDDADGEIMHSDFFFLVDQHNRVRGVYRGGDGAAMQQLAADAASLIGGQQAPVTVEEAHLSESDTGKRLFTTLGCAGCHSQGRIAPPLGGVFGKPVRLGDGSSIHADDAYLRESIVDPGAKIVAGYLEIMPSYRDYLSDRQLTQLVAHLRTLPQLPTDQDSNVLQAAAQQPQTTEIDPVCNMGITVNTDTPHAEYQGRVYHFCSDACRRRFTQEPATYSSKGKQS